MLRWPATLILVALLATTPGLAHATRSRSGQAPAQDGNAAKKRNDGDTSSFLIARRELQNPLFEKTVVLMLPVLDKDGVVGLIVNKPTRITLHVLFPKNSAFKNGTDVAYFGGPVDIKTAGVLFRSSKAFKPAFHLSGDLFVTFDAGLIKKIMKEPKDVSNARLFLGRSQWGTDQLAAEMERGSWFGEKEENSVIFRPDSANVWIELIQALDPGDIAQLRNLHSSSSSGI